MTHAFRILAKNSGLTLSIVGLLALGISATILMFTAFDKVMLRRLPVRDPQELVRLVQKFPQVGTRSEFPYAVYEALNRHSKTLSAVFGETQMNVPLTDPGPAAIVRVGLTTPEFFYELGVPALHGRFLTRDDARENSGDVPAILSHAFWMRQFAADTTAIGRTISLGGRPFVVVGVMPPGFNGIALALLIACVGVYGLFTYMVAHRQLHRCRDRFHRALGALATAIPIVRAAHADPKL